MGVASGCGEQEAGVASGSGWNLWVWLLGVVVRRYIDFLIILIPTHLVSVLFCSSLLIFCSFFLIRRRIRGRKKKNAKLRFFTSRGEYVNCAIITLIRLEISHRTRWWRLKCVIVYLAQVIPAFVMYFVNGASHSSLLIKKMNKK